MSNADRIRDLLDREDNDRRPSRRHNRHVHGSHYDPAYISGGLNPVDDVGDAVRDRGGLNRNSYQRGWDLYPIWYGGLASFVQQHYDQSGLYGLLSGGSRVSTLGSYTLRDAERDWYGYAPNDGFAGYHQKWCGTNGTNRFPGSGSGGGY